MITTDTRTVTLAINQNAGHVHLHRRPVRRRRWPASRRSPAARRPRRGSRLHAHGDLDARRTPRRPARLRGRAARCCVFAGPGAPHAGQPLPDQRPGRDPERRRQHPDIGLSATVTLAIGTNPGGGTLTCTGGTAVGTVNGVATFTGCSHQQRPAPATRLPPLRSNVVPPQRSARQPRPRSPYPRPTAGRHHASRRSADADAESDHWLQPVRARHLEVPAAGEHQAAADPRARASGCVAHIGIERRQPHRHLRGHQGPGHLVHDQHHDDGRVRQRELLLPAVGQPLLPRHVRGRRATSAPAMSPVVRVVVRSLIFLRPTGCTTSGNPCDDQRRAHTITFTATAPPEPARAADSSRSSSPSSASRAGRACTVATRDRHRQQGDRRGAALDVNFNSTGSYRLRANLLPTPVNANSFPTPFEYYSVS